MEEEEEEEDPSSEEEEEEEEEEEPSPFDELVLLQNWDAVRRYVKDQEQRGDTIKAAIRSLLTKHSNFDYPIDILQLLFEKNRDPRRPKFETLTYFGRLPDDELALAGLLDDICCDSALSLGRPPLIRFEIFELILNEITRKYQMVGENAEREKIEFVDYLWENFVSQWNYEKNNIFNEIISFRYVRKEAEEQLLSIQSIEHLKNPANQVLRNLWEMSLMIFRLGETDTTTMPLLLHHLMDHECSIFLLFLVGKLYPNQLFQRDEDGCIPLHYAKKKKPSYHLRYHPRKHWDPRFAWGIDMEFTTYLNCLVNLFPKGAAYADSKGELPLTTVLMDRSTYERDDDDDETVTNLNDLQSLMEGAPQALKTRDIQSHLLPFMMPALILGDTSDDGVDFSEVEALSFIYEILRKDPSAISIAIDPNQNVDSFHAKHLKEKISKLQEKEMTLQTSLSLAEETIARQKEEIERLRRGETYDTAATATATTTSSLKREDCSNQTSSSSPTTSNKEGGETHKTLKRVKLEH